MRCVSCKDLLLNQQSNQILELCTACHGKGYSGRIGIHEVLSVEQVLDASLTYVSMIEAGQHYINSGLIDQALLSTEVYSWR
jgi:type IV pilus assembly protein PilB